MNFKNYQRLNRDRAFLDIKESHSLEKYSLHYASVATRVPESLIKDYCEQNKIHLNDFSNYSKINHHLADKLIRRGLSLRQMTSKLNCSRECIRRYIHKTNQYIPWDKSRFYYVKNKKHIEKSRINILEEVLLKNLRIKYDQATISEKKAYELAFQRNLKPHSLEYITELFEEYYHLKKEGKRKSLIEFGNEFETSASNIGRILKLVGEGAMYWTVPYKKRKHKK